MIGCDGSHIRPRRHIDCLSDSHSRLDCLFPAQRTAGEVQYESAASCVEVNASGRVWAQSANDPPVWSLLEGVDWAPARLGGCGVGLGIRQR